MTWRVDLLTVTDQVFAFFKVTFYDHLEKFFFLTHCQILDIEGYGILLLYVQLFSLCVMALLCEVVFIHIIFFTDAGIFLFFDLIINFGANFLNFAVKFPICFLLALQLAFPCSDVTFAE